MAKQCVVSRDNEGNVESVVVKNYGNLSPMENAIKRNNNFELDKAPNGKDSILYKTYIEDLNLSPEEAKEKIAQLYTDEFGNFFGRWWESDAENISKVTDTNRQPKVVWSGQSEKITGYKGYENTFDDNGQERFDNSAFFVDNIDQARSYSSGMDFSTLTEEQRKSYSKYAKFVEPIFLNIRNLKEVEGENSYKIIPLIEEATKEGVDGFVGNTIHKTDNSKTWTVLSGNQVYEVNSNIIPIQDELIESKQDIIQVTQEEFIPSQLFEELSEQPFMTKDQALSVYKSIYTEELNHWKDSDLNC